MLQEQSCLHGAMRTPSICENKMSLATYQSWFGAGRIAFKGMSLVTLPVNDLQESFLQESGSPRSLLPQVHIEFSSLCLPSPAGKHTATSFSITSWCVTSLLTLSTYESSFYLHPYSWDGLACAEERAQHHQAWCCWRLLN